MFVVAVTQVTAACRRTHRPTSRAGHYVTPRSFQPCKGDGLLACGDVSPAKIQICELTRVNGRNGFHLRRCWI
jgi:hypothetical protein